KAPGLPGSVASTVAVGVPASLVGGLASLVGGFASLVGVLASLVGGLASFVGMLASLVGVPASPDEVPPSATVGPTHPVAVSGALMTTVCIARLRSAQMTESLVIPIAAGWTCETITTGEPPPASAMREMVESFAKYA